MLALASCVGATEEQADCARDWRAEGFRDGARGEPEARFDDYAAACGAAGQPLGLLARKRWLEGWRAADCDEVCPVPEETERERQPLIQPEVVIQGVIGSSPRGGYGIGVRGLSIDLFLAF